MLLRGTIFSKTLEMSTGLTIAGPNDFTGDAPYRTVYLLHGLCGNSDCWADYTRLRLYAEERRILFIMPEVQRSFYTDMRYGGQFLTYVSEELPDICKNLFRISAKREDTAVIGGSMGGYGALKAALNHPERFGACAALSPCCLMNGEEMDALRFMPAEQAEQTYGVQLMRDFTAIFGSELALLPQDHSVRLAEKLHGAVWYRGCTCPAASRMICLRTAGTIMRFYLPLGLRIPMKNGMAHMMVLFR